MRSCVKQLVEALDFIGSQLDNGGQVDVIYLDMLKAFDKVSYRILLRKLRDYGLGGKLLVWLESYLHDRMQRVTAFGVNSQALPVTSGVPQGSIMGPMLFLLYANSLPGTVKSSHVAAFADDTKIFKSIKSPTDATLLQDDLSNLATWSSSTGLMFNESECKAQRITRRHNFVSNMYYLRGCPCKNRPLDFRSKTEFFQIFCVRQLVHMINKNSNNLALSAIFNIFGDDFRVRSKTVKIVLFRVKFWRCS